jgi:hypothetical protein
MLEATGSGIELGVPYVLPQMIGRHRGRFAVTSAMRKPEGVGEWKGTSWVPSTVA